MPLDPSTVVVRSSSILAHEIDGEAVMLSIESGSYFGLDAVGTAIWDLIEEPRSLEGICAVLTERYDVDDETCRTEVAGFLETLLDDGTVQVVTT